MFLQLVESETQLLRTAEVVAKAGARILHRAGPCHDHEVTATDLDVANPNYTATTLIGFGDKIEARELSIPLRIHERGHFSKPGRRDL
jgi:hypothetical protein